MGDVNERAWRWENDGVERREKEGLGEAGGDRRLSQELGSRDWLKVRCIVVLLSYWSQRQ